MVSEQRNYTVLNTGQAKEITYQYLSKYLKNMDQIEYGLPEIYDRYHIWNVPILYKSQVIGEIAVNAYSKEIDKGLSSDICILLDRKEKIDKNNTIAVEKGKGKKRKEPYHISNLKNMVLQGRAELVLSKLPEQSIDLIFTSPPYYNARKQYSEFNTYEDYLILIRKVIQECKRVLIDGKFFVMNSSHVLIPRASRNESSSRIAVPFDLHQIFIEEGFEFVDDIIWEKPEGAGWVSGRGRRFSADRNPMQYKAVPVTEYVMVYRKKPTILIDHFIRNHPNPELIEESKIADGYEKTNIWYISPARDKRHPAIFPKELAEKVIRYYSFKNDVVLDPFGGIGTTAKAAVTLERRFVMIECSDRYISFAREDLDKLNNLIYPVKYEFVDYMGLEEKNSQQRYDFYKMMKLLQENGIEQKEIMDILIKQYPNILEEYK